MSKTKETCTVQTQLYTFVCNVYLYNIYIYTHIYIYILYPSTVALRMKGRYSKGPRCSHEGMKGAMMAECRLLLMTPNLPKKHSKGDCGTSIEIHNIK